MNPDNSEKPQPYSADANNPAQNLNDGPHDSPVAEGQSESVKPPIESKQKKTFSGVLNILKCVVIALLIAPFAVIAFFIIYDAADQKITGYNLQNYANDKAQSMAKILVDEREDVVAQGFIYGRPFGYDKDPTQSTYSVVAFHNKSSLSEIETELANRLKQHGFKRDGGDTLPYYKLYSPAYTGGPLADGNSIVIRYVSDTELVRVTYRLDKYYACPKEYVCERTAKSKETDNIYDIRAYGSLPVISVSAEYRPNKRASNASDF